VAGTAGIAVALATSATAAEVVAVGDNPAVIISNYHAGVTVDPLATLYVGEAWEGEATTGGGELKIFLMNGDELVLRRVDCEGTGGPIADVRAYFVSPTYIRISCELTN
jgi:hypothetical protein